MVKGGATTVLIFLLVGIFLHPGAGLSAMKVEKKDNEVEFLSPWNGARLGDGQIVLTGRLPRGGEGASLFHNGRPLTNLKKERLSFFAFLKAAPGKNVIEASFKGRPLGRINFAYDPGFKGSGGYRYHQPLLDNECSACHGKSSSRNRIEAETCYGCHDRQKNYIYFHGPVAAGECGVCHDPHGSSFPYLARSGPKELCQLCHDQPSSRGHIDRSQNADCNRCHSPHGGQNQQFLKK